MRPRSQREGLVWMRRKARKAARRDGRDAMATVGMVPMDFDDVDVSELGTTVRAWRNEATSLAFQSLGPKRGRW